LNALGYKHETVKHSQNDYVRGEIHTNNIESFWSLLKRGIIGTYHHVSAKYLPPVFCGIPVPSRQSPRSRHFRQAGA